MPRKLVKQKGGEDLDSGSRSFSRSPCREEGDDVKVNVVSRTSSEGVLRKASRKAILSLRKVRHSVHGDISKDYPEFFENYHANGFEDLKKSNMNKNTENCDMQNETPKLRKRRFQESAENILSSTHESLMVNGISYSSEAMDVESSVLDPTKKSSSESQIEVITPTGETHVKALVHTQHSTGPHMLVVSVSKAAPTSTRLQMIPCQDWSSRLTPITEDGDSGDLILANPMVPSRVLSRVPSIIPEENGEILKSLKTHRPRHLSVLPSQRLVSRSSPSQSSPAIRSLPTLSPTRSLSSLGSPRPYLYYLQQYSGRGRQSLLEEGIRDYHPEDDPGFFARVSITFSILLFIINSF